MYETGGYQTVTTESVPVLSPQKSAVYSNCAHSDGSHVFLGFYGRKICYFAYFPSLWNKTEYPVENRVSVDKMPEQRSIGFHINIYQ